MRPGRAWAERDGLWAPAPRRPTALVGLDVPAELARAGSRRTGAMFAAGVVAEVRAARGRAPPLGHRRRIHGLQDVTALLRGRSTGSRPSGG